MEAQDQYDNYTRKSHQSKEARIAATVLNLLLSGLSPASCESSVFVRVEVSLEEASLRSKPFEPCGDFSDF